MESPSERPTSDAFILQLEHITLSTQQGIVEGAEALDDKHSPHRQRVGFEYRPRLVYARARTRRPAPSVSLIRFKSDCFLHLIPTGI